MDQFKPVITAFQANFQQHGDLGASLAIYHEGRSVVEIAGGYTTPSRTTAYRTTDLQMVFSISKAVTAICVGVLIQDGKINPDERVCTYWPAFTGHGKEDLTVAQLLAHRSGVIAFNRRYQIEEMNNWDLMIAESERAKPIWTPGAAFGYHVVSYSWMIGKLVEEVSGISLAQFIQTRLCDPFGITFYMGVPDHAIDQVIPVQEGHLFTSIELWLLRLFAILRLPLWRALTFDGTLKLKSIEVFNRRDVLQAVIPSFNGVTNAPSLAKLFHALIAPVDGLRLIQDETAAYFARPISEGIDQAIGGGSRFSLGMMLSCDNFPMLTAQSYGHYGVSGSLVFNDPTHQVTMAYVTNQFNGKNATDARVQNLLNALRTVLGIKG